MSPWRYLWRIFAPHGLLALAAIALLALTWIAGIALLALSGWFISATALAGAGLLIGLDIFTPSAGIRAAAVTRTLARYGERVIGHETVLAALARLRSDTFARLARLPAARQQVFRSADLQTRLTADIDQLDAAPLRVVGPLLAALAAIAAALVLSWLLAPPMASLLLAASALLSLSAAMLAARAGRQAGRRWVHRRSHQRVKILDHIGGLAELRAYGRERTHLGTLHRLDMAQTRRALLRECVGAIAEHSVQGLILVAALVMLTLALHYHAQGILSGPVVVLLTLMTLGLNEALSTLPGAFWSLGETNEAARRLIALDGTTGASNPPSSKHVAQVGEHPDAESAFACRDLVVGLTHRPLLGPSTFSLRRGLPLLISAPSGFGKSRLLASLLGELAPLSGQVFLFGQCLRDCSQEQRYRHIALLAQETLLLNETLADNLRLARADAEDEALWDALHSVDLDSMVKDSGLGLELRVGEQGRQLSGGQARRLALAAVLLRKPSVALLDEPFSGLDADTEQLVLGRLQGWLSERCSIITTHTPDRFPAHWPRWNLARSASPEKPS